MLSAVLGVFLIGAGVGSVCRGGGLDSGARKSRRGGGGTCRRLSGTACGAWFRGFADEVGAVGRGGSEAVLPVVGLLSQGGGGGVNLARSTAALSWSRSVRVT